MFLTKKELDSIGVLDEFFLSHMRNGEYRLLDLPQLDRFTFLHGVLDDQRKKEHARMRGERV